MNNMNNIYNTHNIKIYGAIGYTILNQSCIFPNTEILLIADMHDEPIKECSSKQIMIDDFLKIFLKKNYKIILEEIPSTKELVEIFPQSVHIKNLRKLYLDNQDKIIAVDIRLDLLDTTLLENSPLPITIHLITLFEFFMIKSNLFNNYILKSYYLKLLKKFRNLIKIYIKYLIKKSSDIDKNKLTEIIHSFDDLLVHIMDYYTICKLYDILKENKYNKIVINCGLYHVEQLEKNIIKYLKFNLKKTEGVTKIKDTKINNLNKTVNICIDYFDF